MIAVSARSRCSRSEEGGAVFFDESGRLELGPDARFAQQSVAHGQQRLADMKAGESLLFEDKDRQLVLAGERGGGAATGSAADDRYVIIP